jgi:hypothetical protein
VHEVGDVPAGPAGGQVGVPAQRDGLAAGRNRARIEPLRRQVCRRVGVQPDLRQLAGVAIAAPRVGVHPPRQLADVAAAVTGHRSGPQLGSCHHPAVHDEYPVVGPGHELLHDDRAALAGGLRVGVGRAVGGGDAHDHVRAVIACARLDHHRAAEGGNGRGRFLRTPGDQPPGHRDAGVGQQPLGEHLVGGDVHADHRGLPGQRGAHELAVPAVPEPQHAQAAEPADRDPAAAGRGGEGRGAHPEMLPFHHRGDPG